MAGGPVGPRGPGAGAAGRACGAPADAGPGRYRAGEIGLAGHDAGRERAFLRLFMDVITISRARPGPKYFDPGRVEITWHSRSTVVA